MQDYDIGPDTQKILEYILTQLAQQNKQLENAKRFRENTRDYHDLNSQMPSGSLGRHKRYYHKRLLDKSFKAL